MEVMSPEPALIEIPTALTAAVWVMTVMLAGMAALTGTVVWFLKREIKTNDEAHKELRSDVKKLLAGQARIEGILTGRRGES